MAGKTQSALSLAFLGCGRATHIHSKVLARSARGVERHYASRNPARAQRYCSRFKGTGVYESYEAAMADPELRVVVVATPPSEHLHLALRAIHAGKDVIVEKPAFLHVEDFATVRRACQETGCRVFVAENYYYKPVLDTLRGLLAAAVVGQPLFLQLSALRLQRVSGWRDDLALAGGGALFEGGIHWINFLSHLGLSIEAVRGFQPARNGKPERSILVVVEYGEGVIATLHYSWEVPSLLRGLRLSRVYGTEGTITFETNGLFVAVHGRQRRFRVPSLTDPSGYAAMWSDFLRALRSAGTPKMTLDLAERDLKLVESIYATLD